MDVRKLGNSQFNYKDLTVYRFIHYYQQIHHVMVLNPAKVLEIGPGDHTVSDFFRRKGIYVKTFDNEPELYPDYLGDIREDIQTGEVFDLVIASEVFEHGNIKHLDTILENIKKVMTPGGYLVVSLPYSTVRLFPERSKYGRIISCEGRLYTFIPYFYTHQLPLTLLRGLYGIFKRKNIRDAFKICEFFPEYLDDKFNVHHWDLGFWPTTRSKVKTIFRRHFTILEERAYINTNCVFFIMRKDS